ncbi:V-type ATPase subunit [Cellulosilyticum ruminicola]|uniref:V-type ATPase subunit n=1 Tax=Cellulosilyticum ruminicola TaxID=425254 RepID=UPI0009F8479A|nr:V-type ATPase subunit [Cellulosilyticum ruminicola]
MNTKLSAKRRTFLSDKEWERAAEFKTVPQMIEFLKKREGYNEAFSKYKLEEFRRGDLEILLQRYMANQLESILHYYSGSYKEFFKTFLMEYEINDLQLILRVIARDEGKEGIEKSFIHSEHYAQCHYQKLISSKNVAQFIENLKGTSYYDVLKTMVQEDVHKREFHMEMKLYILLYKTLMEKANQLEAPDQDVAKKMIGTKADLINIQWIFRATKYYAISPEEMLIYSLPYSNRLTYQKLKTLSYSKNLEELKKQAEKYISYPLFGQSSDEFLDRNIDKYLYDYVMRYPKQGEDIAQTLAYIYALEVEIKDLTSLTEGIRYTLPEIELSKYLVHTL